MTPTPAQDPEQIDAALNERGAEHLRHAGGDRGFAAFLLQADDRCRRHFYVSIFDLPDYCWRDAYDDGMTPAEAVREALEAGI